MDSENVLRFTENIAIISRLNCGADSLRKICPDKERREKDMMNDLELYREQLALCDDKIIDALVERNAIIEKIMGYKEKYGMPIIQPKR